MRNSDKSLSKFTGVECINIVGADNCYGETPKFKETHICKYCGKEYIDYNPYKGFCSWTCKSKYLKEKNKQKQW